MLTETYEEICQECDRFHGGNQPCPMRIAKAFTKITVKNLERLTQADRQWVGEHKDFNITLELEEIIADMM